MIFLFLRLVVFFWVLRGRVSFSFRVYFRIEFFFVGVEWWGVDISRGCEVFCLAFLGDLFFFSDGVVELVCVTGVFVFCSNIK